MEPNADSVCRISARYSIRREVKQTGYLPSGCHGAVNVSCGRARRQARTVADGALQCAGSSGGQAGGTTELPRRMCARGGVDGRPDAGSRAEHRARAV